MRPGRKIAEGLSGLQTCCASPFMPPQNKAGISKGGLSTRSPTLKPEKKLRLALHPSRPAIRRLVIARWPRNDFRGSISGTAVLRLVSPQDLGLILGRAVLDRDVLAQSSGSMA